MHILQYLVVVKVGLPFRHAGLALEVKIVVQKVGEHLHKNMSNVSTVIILLPIQAICL